MAREWRVRGSGGRGQGSDEPEEDELPALDPVGDDRPRPPALEEADEEQEQAGAEERWSWWRWDDDPWRDAWSYSGWHDWNWEYNRHGWHSRRDSQVSRVEETTWSADGRWLGGGGGASAVTPASWNGPSRSEEGQSMGGKPTEKMVVPEFDGEGGEVELGTTARSYLRKVAAWSRCTRLPEAERALALYTHLKGRAWIFAEELDIDKLGASGGMEYYLEWVRVRFMEMEVNKVAAIMTELFKKCRKGQEQSVREFNMTFERLLLRLSELSCELPGLVKAWLYLDRLRLGESDELALLASVGNQYDLKLLQQAAIIHDRGMSKKSWDKGNHSRWKQHAVHVTEAAKEDGWSDEEPYGNGGDGHEESDAELVEEGVAEGLHSAYMAFQDAKSRYREAMKGRGVDREELRKRNDERLKLAKARSYCSVCKRKGHWHKDPECPLRNSSKPPTSGEPKVAQCTHHVQMCYMTVDGGVGDKDDGTFPVEGLGTLEEQKKKVQKVKDQSCCMACGKKGHWRNDPICPLWIEPAVDPKGNVEKKDTVTTKDKDEGTHDVFMTTADRHLPDEDVSAHMLAIADTACTKTVAGHDWYEAYCKWADKHGVDVELVEECDSFKFGASRVHPSMFSVWALFAIRGRCIKVKVAVVQCRVPLLLSRGVLGKLGMIYRVDAQHADFVKIGLQNVNLKLSETGHPALEVLEFVAGLPSQRATWTQDPEVRLCDDMPAPEQYMLLHSAEGNGKWTFKPLFYPKKIAKEVNYMLQANSISPTSFFLWWKQAQQSRDFWIETETEMIRIHVVPRRDGFNPHAWSTSLVEIKSKLLHMIGVKRETDVIPCHADGLGHVVVTDEWQQGGKGKHYESAGGLWIGRSRFEKHTSSPAISPQPELQRDVIRSNLLTMANEPCRAADCAGCDASSHPPEVDSPRASPDTDRAPPSTDWRAGGEQTQGPQQDVSGGAEDQVRGEPSLVAGEGHERTDDQDASRGSPAVRRAGDGLREVQDMDVQGSPHGVCQVGHCRDGSQSELVGGLGALRQLGEAGLGEEEGLGTPARGCGGEGRPRGEGSDQSPCPGGGEPSSKQLEQGVLPTVFQEGINKQARGERDRGGVHGCRAPRGGTERIAGAGDKDGLGQAEAPREGEPGQVSGGAVNDVKVTENSETVGPSTMEYDEVVGRGTLQNEATIGLGTTEYKEAIGSGKTEYKEAIGLGKSGVIEGKGGGNYKVEYDDASDERYGNEDDGGTESGWREYGAKWFGSTSGSEGEASKLSPKQMARRGQHRRKVEASTKKKLYHMGSKLFQVLLACACTMGGIAEEVLAEPIKDLWHATGLASVGSTRVHCLELFAGEAEISSAFARRGLGVMRPRDIRYGDDLRDAATRAALLEEIRASRPLVVWLAPPCTHWCAFSRLNFTKQERRRRRARDKEFLNLIDEVMLLQRMLGGHVVVENPATSDLWQHPVLARWIKDDQVWTFNLHMCAYGMTSKTHDGMYLKKSIKLMVTHQDLVGALGKSCDGEHEHVRVQGQDTSWSAAYPRLFGEAVADVVEKMGKHSVFMVDDEGDHIMEGPSSRALVPAAEEKEGRGASEISFKGTVSGRAAGALRRMHQNLGHPTNRELVRHLTLGGASKDLIAAAHNLTCKTCLKCVRPQAHRVVKPAALLDFGDAVALDIIYIDTVESKGNLALNMVDVASSYQVVVPLESRHADVVTDTFYKHWVSWAGTPFKIVLDLDTGFQDSFWKITAGDGIAMKSAAGQAHWQNGVAERYMEVHGRVFGTSFARSTTSPTAIFLRQWQQSMRPETL